jgi:glycosyltransferase involved in cell wall biosynthesis
MLVSVVINNHNYGRFLADAVDSALRQTYSPIEIIVVDDGSTDDSAAVIGSYGDRIVSVCKANGGQGSAFNEGFRKSHGDVVIFLDADDALLPDAISAAAKEFREGVSKIHWPLWRADDALTSVGLLFPPEDLPFGDLRDFTFAEGPSTTLSTVTSANAFARTYLEQVMPMPEPEHRISADGYVCGLAPAYGIVGRVAEPMGLYRIHNSNNYKRMPVRERIRKGIGSIELQWDTLESHAKRKGVSIDRDRWRRNSYFHRLQSAMNDIEGLVDNGGSFILFDEDQWGLEHDLGGRFAVPFLEHDGYYWGTPANDDHAIVELGRLRAESNASHFVVGWPAFWWTEEYAGFADYMNRNFNCVIRTNELLAYDLRDAA